MTIIHIGTHTRCKYTKVYIYILTTATVSKVQGKTLLEGEKTLPKGPRKWGYLKNPLKMHDLGYPYSVKPPHLYIYICDEQLLRTYFGKNCLFIRAGRTF